MTPIFNDFCAKEDGRYKLTQPWVKGGYRYATDGRSIVREATTDADWSPPDTTPPNAASLEWDRRTIDTIKLPRLIAGAPLGKCNFCNGLGLHQCKNDSCRHECQCDACDGNGQVAIEPFRYFEFEGVSKPPAIIAVNYLRKLIKHGVKELELLTHNQYRFRIGEIVGMVMGCSPPGNNDSVAIIRDGKVVE